MAELHTVSLVIDTWRFEVLSSSTAEAHFVLVCTEVLSVRRVVVEVYVDAVVNNMAMTQLPVQDYNA